MSTLSYFAAAPVTPLVTKTSEILQRRLLERAGIRLIPGDKRADIVLAIEKGIGREGFRIESAGEQTRITGNDERGLLYGVGKYLRDRSWRGVSVPEKQVRGMYFATHFHNFYHDAPIEQVTQYIEELALWGCNVLSVWFDMHHYNGIADPAAQAMLDRLRAMLRAANAVGMGAGLTMLANEGYANSPVPLRADWRAGQNGYTRPPVGHYHVELCPSQTEAVELLLASRRELFAALSGIEFEYLWIWPYDQGGCTCARCAPWGANGFIKLATKLGELCRQIHPRAKTVLSTWGFDTFTTGEWEGVHHAFVTKPAWADYLMVDLRHGPGATFLGQHGAPGGLPLLDFPEISMMGMTPWGGFGANAMPQFWGKYWAESRERLAGGFPYSEGIFEDLNKVVLLQSYWDGRRSATEIMREYIAAEFAPAVVDDVANAIAISEKNLGTELSIKIDDHDYMVYYFMAALKGGKTYRLRYKLPALTQTAECLDLFKRAEAQLPTRVQQSWRWRVLAIRAAMDDALAKGGQEPCAAYDELFESLIDIYYAQNAEEPVLPPSRAAIAQLVAHGDVHSF
ncbi:MAG: hypothetical protein WCH84_01410 [Verrucomicrobiota bacterium]